MKTPISIAILLLTTVLASSAFAGDIYKWTDADGHLNYGDRPMGMYSERLAIQSRPTNPARFRASLQARSKTHARDRDDVEAAAALGLSTMEFRAQVADRAVKCTSYKDRLETMLRARRLYHQDEDGERTYLDENEMLDAREQVQTQVEDYCSA